jgi:hypothetical protein
MRSGMVLAQYSGGYVGGTPGQGGAILADKESVHTYIIVHVSLVRVMELVYASLFYRLSCGLAWS